MGKTILFNPVKDIPDLSGKIIIVTGGNNGLGKESIIQLAKHNPTKIYLGARNRAKAEAAISEIKALVPAANIQLLEMDLSSLVSVKKAAEEFLLQETRLDILMNNAGIWNVPPALTHEGYEITFGTNHMGPALFTRLLLPLLQKTAALAESDVRIVNLSSKVYSQGPKPDFLYEQINTPLANISYTARYGQSKLANLYHAQQLAVRYPNILCTAIHPGSIPTGLASGIMEKYHYLSWIFKLSAKYLLADVGEGAVPQLFAATGKREMVENGGFYWPGVKRKEDDGVMLNKEAAERLWDWTEKELVAKGY